MIVVRHLNNQIVDIFDRVNQEQISITKQSIAQQLIQLAVSFPDQLIIWVDDFCAKDVDYDNIPDLFEHKKILLSYHPTSNFLPSSIGYVDESLFINVYKSKKYPTWQMSSFVGGVYSEVLLATKTELRLDDDFEYFLNSFAKILQPLGLLCYSEPLLLKTKIKTKIQSKKTTDFYQLFRFVKEHYRLRWTFLLFINLIVYENKYILLPFLTSIRYKKIKISNHLLDSIQMCYSNLKTENEQLDVIIPTIGRKKYLYDVLKDFSKQTVLPKKIIITEQNPLLETNSELDYIYNESWPFKIDHIFTHQSGACNARNLALQKVEHDWVFFADDDIRLEVDFIESAFVYIKQTKAKAFTFNSLQKGEVTISNKITSWNTFGTCSSFVYKDAIDNVFFDMRYEFGFGEDVDYGMQIRKNGFDVLYLPDPVAFHLKAPIGGFRFKVKTAWENDFLQPKPSPTVMLCKLENYTKEQLCSYKSTLFIKYFKENKFQNPIKYLFDMKKKWNKSVLLANQLGGRL